MLHGVARCQNARGRQEVAASIQGDANHKAPHLIKPVCLLDEEHDALEAPEAHKHSFSSASSLLPYHPEIRAQGLRKLLSRGGQDETSRNVLDQVH